MTTRTQTVGDRYQLEFWDAGIGPTDPGPDVCGVKVHDPISGYTVVISAKTGRSGSLRPAALQAISRLVNPPSLLRDVRVLDQLGESRYVIEDD